MSGFSYSNSFRSIEIEMIRAEVRGTHRTGADQLLTIKTGDEWLKQQHGANLPARLFGEFWYEQELCILFGDTNVGKSVLAVQLGNSLANAGAITPFALDSQRPQNVLYIDFELSAGQFELRYSKPQDGPHNFGPHFHRAELNANQLPGTTWKEQQQCLNRAIENAIIGTRAAVLIIDNLTYLCAGAEKATQALPLIKNLQRLRKKYRLSVLVLAHTPKRNMASPLTQNDLQGSKMLINFCDSAFAISRSLNHEQLYYLKQIKQRNTPQVYGTGNICVCKLTKPERFLKFEFTGNAAEKEHLYGCDRRQQAAVMARQGLSQRQIAHMLDTSAATVNRLLKKEKV